MPTRGEKILRLLNINVEDGPAQTKHSTHPKCRNTKRNTISVNTSDIDTSQIETRLENKVKHSGEEENVHQIDQNDPSKSSRSLHHHQTPLEHHHQTLSGNRLETKKIRPNQREEEVLHESPAKKHDLPTPPAQLQLKYPAEHHQEPLVAHKYQPQPEQRQQPPITHQNQQQPDYKHKLPETIQYSSPKFHQERLAAYDHQFVQDRRRGPTTLPLYQSSPDLNHETLARHHHQPPPEHHQWFPALYHNQPATEKHQEDNELPHYEPVKEHHGEPPDTHYHQPEPNRQELPSMPQNQQPPEFNHELPETSENKQQQKDRQEPPAAHHLQPLLEHRQNPVMLSLNQSGPDIHLSGHRKEPPPAHYHQPQQRYFQGLPTLPKHHPETVHQHKAAHNFQRPAYPQQEALSLVYHQTSPGHHQEAQAAHHHKLVTSRNKHSLSCHSKGLPSPNYDQPLLRNLKEQPAVDPYEHAPEHQQQPLALTHRLTERCEQTPVSNYCTPTLGYQDILLPLENRQETPYLNKSPSAQDSPTLLRQQSSILDHGAHSLKQNQPSQGHMKIQNSVKLSSYLQEDITINYKVPVVKTVTRQNSHLRSHILDMDTMKVSEISPCRAIKEHSVNYTLNENVDSETLNKVSAEKSSSMSLRSLFLVTDNLTPNDNELNEMDFTIIEPPITSDNIQTNKEMQTVKHVHDGLSFVPAPDSPETTDVIPTSGETIYYNHDVQAMSPSPINEYHDSSDNERLSSSLCLIIDEGDSDYVPEETPDTSYEKSNSPIEKYNSNPLNTLKEGYNKEMQNLQQCITEEIALQCTDVQSKEIDNFVSIGMKSGRSVKDKRQNCIYCNNLVSNFARHLIRRHKNEPEVVDFWNLPKSSKERKDKIRIIQSKGNFIHNKEVLSKGQGSLIVSRRPTNETDTSSYLPCIHCKAFFKNHLLFRHQRACAANLNKENPIKNTRRVQSQSRLLIDEVNDIPTDFQQNILSAMQGGDVMDAIKKDKLICQFGVRLYRNHGERHKKQYIRNRMRDLGRLRLALGRINKTSVTLKEYIRPSAYSQIVEGVKAVAGYDQQAGQFVNPSTAIHLGYSLKQLAEIVQCNGIIENNCERRNEAKDFLKVMNTQWTYDITSNAQRNLKDRHTNSSDILPLAEDLQKLHKYTVSEEKVWSEALRNSPDENNWRKLAKVMLVRVMVLNRRRSGESQRIFIKDFQANSHGSRQQEIVSSLSEIEKQLTNIMSRFEIKGKRGRTVPVLITEGMKSCMELLITTRDAANILPENPYLFAVPRTPDSCLKAADVLREFAKDCGAKENTKITSTGLRKHVATISQLLDLQNLEQKQLATFMGHNLNIHEEYYRLPEDTNQLARISKILLAMERGKMHELKGKTLNDMDQAMDQYMNDGDSPASARNENIFDMEEPSSSVQNFALQATSEHSDSDEEFTIKTNTVKQKSYGKRKVNKIKPRVNYRIWSDGEKEAIFRHMHSFVLLNRVPNKKDCLQVQEKENLLKTRTWTEIKSFVHNQIKKKDRR